MSDRWVRLWPLRSEQDCDGLAHREDGHALLVHSQLANPMHRSPLPETAGLRTLFDCIASFTSRLLGGVDEGGHD